MDRILPIMLLKGLILLPNQEVKLELNNDLSKDIATLATAKYNREILVVTPLNKLEENPDITDLPDVGVIGKIKSKVSLPNNNVRLIIKGFKRVKILEYTNNLENLDILEAHIANIDLPKLDEVEEKATIKKLNELIKDYVATSKHISNSIINTLKHFENLGDLTDMICSFLPLTFNQKLEYIAEINPLYRARNLLKDIKVEIEVLKLDEKLEADLQNSLEASQKEYILKEKIHLLEQELGISENATIQKYKDKLNDLNLSQKTHQKITNEIKRLAYTSDISPETAMLRNYLDWVLELPWHKTSFENNNLNDISSKLNASHYGLEEIKTRILEYVALKNNNPDLISPIICLVGPPGVGKTTIAQTIAQALNRKFYKISLAGLNDSATLIGHRRTYMGSAPGKIIQALKKCEVKNPLILIDEIDKVIINNQDDPSSCLLDILDKEQNKEFIDNYIEEPFDLSQIFFILTANSLETIPEALKDRLEIIELNSYTTLEKIDIAQKYLIPRLLEENQIDSKIISINDDILTYLIDSYTKEAGVRELSRILEKLIRKLIYLGKGKERTKLSRTRLKDYLGIPLYTKLENKNHDLIGKVNGLGVNKTGGIIIPIEALVFEGKGNFILTGMLGEVMQESVKVALDYIKGHIVDFHLQDFFFNIKDIHLHFLEGAMKKDGPSAGVAITTSILSLLSNKTINNTIAFSGEISLNGDILKVGGIKEKVIGAFNNNIKTIYLPLANELELEEIPSEIKTKLNIKLVKNYQEIYNELF